MVNTLQLVWTYLPSCVGQGLVQEGETVVLYTSPVYTDPAYPGYVPATVVKVIGPIDCANDYQYIFEYNSEDLPEGMAKLAKCEILYVGCSDSEETEIDVVIGARLQQGDDCCVQIVETKQRVRFAGVLLGDPEEEVGEEICCDIPSPYPYHPSW